MLRACARGEQMSWREGERLFEGGLRIIRWDNSTNDGRQLVRALKSVRDESTLSFLDVRACQRQEDQPHEHYRTDNLFLKGMLDLGFEKKLFGLFTRPAKWNERVRRRLVGNLS